MCCNSTDGFFSSGFPISPALTFSTGSSFEKLVKQLKVKYFKNKQNPYPDLAQNHNKLSPTFDFIEKLQVFDEEIILI